jgi:hypothetical protein
MYSDIHCPYPSYAKVPGKVKRRKMSPPSDRPYDRRKCYITAVTMKKER